ncbi:hypothetical protein FQR65_LT01861 [Abscondita terminalis]|nr:hypothetical protein FQR65_LT01861 [Abscondita terminalis]
MSRSSIERVENLIQDLVSADPERWLHFISEWSVQIAYDPHFFEIILWKVIPYQGENIKAVKKIIVIKEDSLDENNEIGITQYSFSEWERVEEEEGGCSSVIDALEGNFLVVKVSGKTSQSGRDYVGVDFEMVTMLTFASGCFQVTNEQSSFIAYEEELLVLPKPIKDTRQRFKDMLYFSIDWIEFNMH